MKSQHFEQHSAPGRVRLSVTIAAHPDRAAMANALAARLDREMVGEPRVVFDDGQGEWPTHDRAWRAHDPDATHHLVLQDDAVPCRDLIPGTERLIAGIPPTAGMSLYLGTHRKYRGRDPRHHAVKKATAIADTKNIYRIWIPGLWWGVAAILPVPRIPSMLAYCTGRREVYDLRLTRWCQHTQTWIAYPYPSLVDHADTDSIVIPGRETGRVAVRHLGPYTTALHTPALQTPRDGPELWLYPTGPKVWPPAHWEPKNHAEPDEDFPRPPDQVLAASNKEGVG